MSLSWNLGEGGDISLPVLQAPAGEEGGSGGLPNILKEGEKDEKAEEESKLGIQRN